MARAKPYARLLAASIDAAALRVLRAKRKSKGLRLADAPACALVEAPRHKLAERELILLRMHFAASLLLGEVADEPPAPPVAQP